MARKPRYRTQHGDIDRVVEHMRCFFTEANADFSVLAVGPLVKRDNGDITFAVACAVIDCPSDDTRLAGFALRVCECCGHETRRDVLKRLKRRKNRLFEAVMEFERELDMMAFVVEMWPSPAADGLYASLKAQKKPRRVNEIGTTLH